VFTLSRLSFYGQLLILKACPHWQRIVAENGNKLLPEFVAVNGNNLLRGRKTLQQSFRFWQQFVAENGNKVASVDRPLGYQTRATQHCLTVPP